MMMNEEKQPVDVSKQPIVFGGYICFSIFLSFCGCCFNFDVIKTIILFYLFFLSICEDK